MVELTSFSWEKLRRSAINKVGEKLRRSAIGRLRRHHIEDARLAVEAAEDGEERLASRLMA